MCKKSVMLALSGGVDSSVCAHFLKQQGFEVKAVVMKMSSAHNETVKSAQKAAKELGISLTVLDLQDEFQRLIIDSFISDYENARTPNPCVICNPLIKFKYLKEIADKEGCDFYATGHYACVENEGGRFYIKRAQSAARDQSYMLYRLSQDRLSRLILPLGELEKNDVRKTADELDLFCKDAPDSQENCFIPSGDYASYILEHGGTNKSGCFISPEGKNLGAHKGIIHYTVGQRKGLGLSMGSPVFVNKIDGQSGNVFLTYSGGQFKSEITVSDCVFMALESVSQPLEIGCKIRSAARCEKAILDPLENGKASVKFFSPVSAPTPGQSAVFYINDRVLGGGFIV